jgi:type VI secretion system VasI family protein
MKNCVLALAAIIASSSIAIAQQPSSVAIEQAQRCSAELDTLKRLNCFDGVFPNGRAEGGELGSTIRADQPTASLPSAWRIDLEKSPLDDSPKVTAILLPDSTSAGNGFMMGSNALALRCHENTTSVVLSTSLFMASDTVRVTTRIGAAAPSSSAWERSSNMRAVGLWSGSQAIPFIRSLEDGETLFVRVEDRERVDMTFNLSDVSEARRSVAQACGWDPSGGTVPSTGADDLPRQQVCAAWGLPTGSSAMTECMTNPEYKR